MSIQLIKEVKINLLSAKVKSKVQFAVCHVLERTYRHGGGEYTGRTSLEILPV